MKGTIIATVAAVVLIGGAFALGRGGTDEAPSAPVNNVKMENGVQVVEIDARGGYKPRVSEAQAGVETVVRINTANTFDCSLALVLPDANYRNILPQSGTTDIPIGVREAGSTFRGLCSMGMYNFSINFN